MNKLIIPTGYMGSGSSAVTSLLSEFANISADYGSHEYVFMHTPGGVFDLEDKLLHGNNAIRSDEALHTFKKVMNQLFDKKYWWVGNYKKTFGPEFINITDNYIEKLITVKTDQYWYYQENTNTKMFFQLIFKRIVKLFTLNKIETKKPLIYEEMWLSLPTNEEFYEKSRVYLNTLFSNIGLDKRNIILDQLLLPFNLHRFDNYFGENTYAVVVSRDPRDTFLINKYVYNAANEGIPYPTDVRDFCNFYKRMRLSEKPNDNKRIIRINFEDLVYNYDQTLSKLKDELEINHLAHSKQFTEFNPNVSIENTQLFTGNDKYKNEVEIIEKELKEYLYQFPYEREHDISKSF